MNPEKKRIRPQKRKLQAKHRGPETFLDYPGTRGGVLTDAWLIPSEEAEACIRQREACAAQLMAEIKTFCSRDFRDLAQTEDGEVVWGDAVFGAERSCPIFLDPQMVENAMEAAKKRNCGNLFWKAADWRSSQPSSTPILSCNWIDSLIIFPSLETEIKKQPEISCCRKFQAVSRQAS